MAIIYIHRQLPIVDGFVAVPPNNPRDNTTTEPDTYIRSNGGETVRIGSTGRPTQEFIRIDGVRSDDADCCT